MALLPCFYRGVSRPLVQRRSQTRCFASQPIRETPHEQHSPRLEDIGVFRAYGKPVATIFLWSALTYMSLQAIWSKLYFDEVRLETEARIDDLQTEIGRLNHHTKS
ncbi:hypothetical protein COEREDRAFT_83325 [Coemansia reversa NRRL 1564]|uniref:Uncharacterized protein n=1 Tax=Coemansia reversa (strain ATCC 12441 / NRRL 1564) TaxID=763665 RepID=A0A2G5B3Z8_COERN|nr:hypothetical protein COEREDRAFT_83325 [Coemansia reversa NRRL 1564]|eukprot:PIA13729.1 hypothetical protein COEREDRAFT_83325 [Coemansia reversa NRRL 1564]